MNSNLSTFSGAASDVARSIREDLLIGASAMAECLFGDASRRRTIYFWYATTDIPIKQMKKRGRLYASRRELLEWFANK